MNTTLQRPIETGPDTPPIVRILDLPIHRLDMEAALNRMDAFIASGGTHHVITADASMLVMAQDDPELRAIVANAELVTPDSAGVLWAAKRQNQPLAERVSGVEIVEKLCARSARNGCRLYFLGAAPGVAQQAADRMNAKYPGCQVIGTRDGFFQPADVPALIAAIKAARPDVLCVALGIPKQEKWIHKHREAVGVPVLIGVGGTLDVLSGTVKRAPRPFQKLRLEWLWRVLSNPKKISKVALLPRFVRLILRGN